LQQAVINLDKAFKGFFTKKAVFPAFKKKNSGKFYIPQRFRTENCKLYIPKLNSPIKIKMHRIIKGDIRNITIERILFDKYYVSILVEREIKQIQKADGIVAIDVGIESFATMAKTSLIDIQVNHKKLDNPKSCLRKKNV
jgi:putative transposase